MIKKQTAGTVGNWLIWLDATSSELTNRPLQQDSTTHPVSCAVEALEATGTTCSTKHFVCRATIAMTDVHDISDCKVLGVSDANR